LEEIKYYKNTFNKKIREVIDIWIKYPKTHEISFEEKITSGEFHCKGAVLCESHKKGI
jgi:hypothetical protein